MPTHKPHEGILNKKQNIIQAATHLFAEQGFEGTTTLQIANEADVTEPLIYIITSRAKTNSSATY